jgi:hypothetical protein
MAQGKRKAEKVSRKDVVVIERSAQQIREGVYRIRAKLEPGLDAELVEASFVAQVETAHASLNGIMSALDETMKNVSILAVLEDME